MSSGNNEVGPRHSAGTPSSVPEGGRDWSLRWGHSGQLGQLPESVGRASRGQQLHAGQDGF